jgi:hypothetical protein
VYQCIRSSNRRTPAGWLEMWGQYPLEIHHIEVRCNVEQPTKPHMTVASLGSAYFNMVIIVKCYQGIVGRRINYAGLTGEGQVLI